MNTNDCTNECTNERKKWLLNNPHLVQHLGRNCYFRDDCIPTQLEQMTIPELIEEIGLFRELHRALVDDDENNPTDGEIVEAPIGKLRHYLRWYYQAETHSCLLRNIAVILANEASDIHKPSNKEPSEDKKA